MIRGLLTRVGLTLGSVLVPLSMATAGVIDYTTTSLGGNLWRYDYTINNTTPSIGFDGFTVYFDVNSFELLTGATAPANWDLLVLEPDTTLPADGLYDALHLGGPVGDGVSLSGFSVSLTYLGAGTPGAQPFELYMSDPFAVVYTGETSELRDPGQLPEPTSLALVLLAIGGAAASRRSRHSAPA